MSQLVFRAYTFEELSNQLLYNILALRSRIFVSEQQSPYVDVDGLDQMGLHLCIFQQGCLVGYGRVLGPRDGCAEATLGRIVLEKDVRGKGLGKRLLEELLRLVVERCGSVCVRIEAQQRLVDFYRKFGFMCVDEPYDLDGVMHCVMIKRASC